MLKYILSYIPQALPVGLTAFNAWADEVIALSKLPADPTALKMALATNIMHAETGRAHFSKQYFVKRLLKSAANQVAFQVLSDIDEAQKAKRRQEAEELAAAEVAKNTIVINTKAEVTAAPETVTDEPKI